MSKKRTKSRRHLAHTLWAAGHLSAVAAVEDGKTTVDAGKATFPCMNPLFRSHWYTGRTDTAQFDSQPLQHSRLVRCKMWNGQDSCCNGAMEASQQVSFDAQRANFDVDIWRLKEYLKKLTILRNSEVFTNSEKQEQALFNRALASFQPALAAADSCVDALMAFTAGLICFGCNPLWSSYVWRDDVGNVKSVNVDTASCMYVSRGCGKFGRAIQNVYARIGESILAKRPTIALPDFTMLADRESICRWLRVSLAMQPSGRPMPLEYGKVLDRRLNDDKKEDPVTTTTSYVFTSNPLPEAVIMATARPTTVPPPNAPTVATDPSMALDPVADGLASGFQYKFYQPEDDDKSDLHV
eukprot:TRINITY_DN3416_c2_g1_i1.p1 TRINITY_DN3416_c2_g1~~TRINITY_DN3416_c2_g1_i1.p1  ORF type:complete len:364 (+),score=60.06 TRINITY_DN3416_c2_g1_i1:31-1092(+)